MMIVALASFLHVLQESAALVEDLGSDDVAVRDRATRDLRRRLKEAEPRLKAGLAHADAEVRARCADLLAELHAPPPALGKVCFLNSRENNVAVDRRSRDGVKVGERFEIYRGRERVGRLEITDVQAWGSWAKPCDGTDFASLRKGDVISPAQKP